MTWTDLTTPRPRRPPPPKHPLFTRKFFSTKSFGPGHLVGAATLAFGLFAIGKVAISRSQAERDRALRAARSSRQRDERTPTHERGQYGRPSRE